MNCGTPKFIWENRSRNLLDKPDRGMRHADRPDRPHIPFSITLLGTQLLVTSCGRHSDTFNSKCSILFHSVRKLLLSWWLSETKFLTLPQVIKYLPQSTNFNCYNLNNKA